MQYLVKEVMPPEQAKRVHVFNSFFYRRLADEMSSAGCSAVRGNQHHQRVEIERQATAFDRLRNVLSRDIDIFSKDFLFVPINENLHWSLALISRPRGPSSLPKMMGPAEAAAAQAARAATAAAAAKKSGKVWEEAEEAEGGDARVVAMEVERGVGGGEAVCTASECEAGRREQANQLRAFERLLGEKQSEILALQFQLEEYAPRGSAETPF